jgi:hypothetical protein
METGNESTVVTMATGILDAGTVYKIMAWVKAWKRETKTNAYENLYQ